MNRQKGFTLIELLVVISIIALLMGILIPVIRSAREQARKAVCLAHVKSLITGVHVYAVDYDGNIPASIDGMNASWNFVCWHTYDQPRQVTRNETRGTFLLLRCLNCWLARAW